MLREFPHNGEPQRSIGLRGISNMQSIVATLWDNLQMSHTKIGLWIFHFLEKTFFPEMIERLGFTQSALEHCCSLFLYQSFYLLRVQASKKAFDGHESRCEKNKKKEKHRNPCTKKNAKNHSFFSIFLEVLHFCECLDIRREM